MSWDLTSEKSRRDHTLKKIKLLPKLIFDLLENLKKFCSGSGKIYHREGYYIANFLPWSVITCNKVNFYNSALKPLPRLPNRSKRPQLWDILIFETYRTSGSTGKFQGSPKIGGNWRETTTRHPPIPPRHPLDTLRYPPTLPYHAWYILDIAKCSRRHSQTFLTLNRHLLTPSFLPESLRTSLDNSNASQTAWQVLASSQGCSWGAGGMCLGCLRMFWSIQGVLGVFQGVRGAEWGSVG